MHRDRETDREGDSEGDKQAYKHRLMQQQQVNAAATRVLQVTIGYYRYYRLLPMPSTYL